MSSIASPPRKTVFWTVPQKSNWQRFRASGAQYLSVKFAWESLKNRLCWWVMRRLCQTLHQSTSTAISPTLHYCYTSGAISSTLYHCNSTTIIPNQHQCTSTVVSYTPQLFQYSATALSLFTWFIHGIWLLTTQQLLNSAKIKINKLW